MIAPVPTQISKLPHRLHVANTPTKQIPHPRHRMLHVMSASLLLSTASAYFPSARGCTSKPFPTTGFQALKRTNSFACIGLPPLCALFSLFSAFVSFVLNGLQPLFPKYRGYGYPGPIGGLSAGVDEDSRCRRPFCGTPGGGCRVISEGHARETFPSPPSYLNASTCRAHTASLASSNARSGKEKFRHERSSPPTR